MNSVYALSQAEAPTGETALLNVAEPIALLRLVYEANAGLSWPASASGAVGGVPVAVLRTLLTYCYAAGLTSSRDIEFASEQDRTVRYICANHAVDADVIRRFRREQRPWLARGLAAVLSLAAQRAGGCAEANYAARSAARWGQSDEFQLEADRRLKAAVRADSMELDA